MIAKALIMKLIKHPYSFALIEHWADTKPDYLKELWRTDRKVLIERINRRVENALEMLESQLKDENADPSIVIECVMGYLTPVEDYDVAHGEPLSATMSERIYRDLLKGIPDDSKPK